jgi:large subunit ribosomal protein L25
MEKQELEVQRRRKIGKGHARRLRAGGHYPAVCYRKGIEPIPLSLEKKILDTLLQKTGGQNVLIQLKILDDKGPATQEAVILKDVQRDHLSRICHLDFLAVRMDEAILVETPLKLIGEPTEALRDGGLVQQLRRTLEVECLPGDIPECIEVDISGLTMGATFHVGQVKVPEGVRILTDSKETLVLISAPTTEAAPKSEAEGEEEGAEAKEGKTGETSSS